MNQHFNNRRAGFTIIELILSMTFVAILLISVAILTIHMSKIYNKGITLRTVNQASQTITSDLTRTIGSTVPFTIPAQSDPVPTTPAPGVRLIDINGRGGRLCTGSKSYAWNYPPAFEAGGNPLNRYTSSSSEIRFVRVNDSAAALCTVTPLTSIDKSTATELLAVGDRSLVMHNFSIVQTTTDTNEQALYRIRFILGTDGKTGAINTTTQTCEAPTGGDGFEEYCAVNVFDFVVRASNVGVVR